MAQKPCFSDCQRKRLFPDFFHHGSVQSEYFLIESGVFGLPMSITTYVITSSYLSYQAKLTIASFSSNRRADDGRYLIRTLFLLRVIIKL